MPTTGSEQLPACGGSIGGRTSKMPIESSGALAGRLGLGFTCGTGLRHPPVLLRQHASRRHVGNRRLQFVLPATDDVSVATHHSVEANAGDVGRIILRGLPHLRIEHVRSFEEVGFGRAWHQAGDGDTGVLQLGAKGERERIYKCLRAVVDRVIGARHEPRNRAGQ